MKQKAVSGKLLLVYLEGACGLSVRFSKYSEQHVPFDALLRRRLQNSSSEVVASFKTTREIMPHPVAHAHKLLLVLRRRRPLGSHRFVSIFIHIQDDRSTRFPCTANYKNDNINGLRYRIHY